MGESRADKRASNKVGWKVESMDTVTVATMVAIDGIEVGKKYGCPDGWFVGPFEGCTVGLLTGQYDG
jgi:hypothetical protein